MNITYEFTITALCPKDRSIRNYYQARVESTDLIWAERLAEAADAFTDEAVSQEAVTGTLAQQFPGTVVTLTGQHGPVRITSVEREIEGLAKQ